MSLSQMGATRPQKWIKTNLDPKIITPGDRAPKICSYETWSKKIMSAIPLISASRLRLTTDIDPAVLLRICFDCRHPPNTPPPPHPIPPLDQSQEQSRANQQVPVKGGQIILSDPLHSGIDLEQRNVHFKWAATEEKVENISAVIFTAKL